MKWVIKYNSYIVEVIVLFIVLQVTVLESVIFTMCTIHVVSNQLLFIFKAVKIKMCTFTFFYYTAVIFEHEKNTVFYLDRFL